MARTTIIYHNDGSKTVIKDRAVVSRTSANDVRLDAQEHQNINNTFYLLEQEGKLNDMPAKQKVFVRDLHIHAQDPRYWE